MSSLFPVAGLVQCSDETADELLARWEHNLGPCNRPFGVQSWVLEVESTPVALAVSASTASATAADFSRYELVELARLAGERWATRVMLRLWREVCAPRWPYWPTRAFVAYSQNDRHEGRIYRFDGWERVTTRAGSSGGGASLEEEAARRSRARTEDALALGATSECNAVMTHDHQVETTAALLTALYAGDPDQFEAIVAELTVDERGECLAFTIGMLAGAINLVAPAFKLDPISFVQVFALANLGAEDEAGS